MRCYSALCGSTQILLQDEFVPSTGMCFYESAILGGFFVYCLGSFQGETCVFFIHVK